MTAVNAGALTVYEKLILDCFQLNGHNVKKLYESSSKQTKLSMHKSLPAALTAQSKFFMFAK